MDITAVVAIICSIGFIPFIVFLVYRHRERKALIEKGLSAEILATATKDRTQESLKYGILLVGLAVGILVGNILDEYTRMSEEVSYFSMIFLFGGLALLAFYSLAKKEKE
jgi:NAD/NADP transhydrogenase beta subunit